MEKNVKDSEPDNTFYYVIPRNFLDNIAGNPLFEFLSVTTIGLFSRATHHYCERKEGIKEGVVIYCDDGYGSFSVNGGENRVVNPGQTLIIAPGVPHSYSASYNNPWTIFWMHVRGSFFDSFIGNWNPVSAKRSPAAAGAFSELITVSGASGKRMKELFFECFQLLKMPYQWEDFFYLCQLASTIISLIPRASKRSAGNLSGAGNQALETAVMFMKNHLHESITLDELAKVSGFSQSHLYHLFHESSGYAPIEYYLRMKMQAASKDIFFTDIPIRKISETYGISDPYYFSRLFKRITGLSPTHYRRRLQGYSMKPGQELPAGSQFDF